MERTILHCDLNGFYAAVECVKTPSLRYVPMAVAGDPKNRHGIILAKNELAKQYHIETAETIWQARKKCPDLVLVPPDHRAYAAFSRQVNQLYREYTDLVEPFGIDESWLDVSGVLHLFGSGVEIADQVRQKVRETLGLTISVGVSFNKAFAKLGSDLKKPDATTLISVQNYQRIVWPLPVSTLLYVGKAATQTLARLQIHTIGDLALAEKALLESSLGKMGIVLHQYANGIDSSPVKSVTEERELKSVGNGMTFPQDVSGFEAVRSEVFALSDEVSSRLRRNGLKCTTISVAIKAPNFQTISRQKPLSSPTHLTREIANCSMELIRASWSEHAPIRSLTVTALHLLPAEPCEAQLSLFQDASAPDRERQEKLAKAMDHIRQKYGKQAISLGTQRKPSND